MRKDSRSHTNPDLLETCRRLAETAETFANQAPRQKRIEAERSALSAALSHAQLVLSVARFRKRWTRVHRSVKSSNGTPERSKTN